MGFLRYAGRMTTLPPPPARFALVQMTSGIDPARNLERIDAAMGAAAMADATIAFLPEMALMLDRDRSRSAPNVSEKAVERWTERLGELCRTHGIWLHNGSMAVEDGTDGRRANRSILFDNMGAIRARYDKIHLFDVDLPTGESWRESSAYRGGDAICVTDSPIGRIGMSICFDMRFPELYAALRRAGADVLAVPAAFTVPTGRAHWHVLLRARAIETACPVIAAAQVGAHEDGRATYGHSLATDAWGQVLCDMGGDGQNEPRGQSEGVGQADAQGDGWTIAVAEVDQGAIRDARSAIPLDQSRNMRAIQP